METVTQRQLLALTGLTHRQLEHMRARGVVTSVSVGIPPALARAGTAGTRSRAEGDRRIEGSKLWPRHASAGEWLAGEAKPPSARWRSCPVEGCKYRGTGSVGGCRGRCVRRDEDRDTNSTR